jgi:predicted metal-dependent hydrolase
VPLGRAFSQMFQQLRLLDEPREPGPAESPPEAPVSAPRAAAPALPVTPDMEGYTLTRSGRRKRTIQISVGPDLSVAVVAPLRLARTRIDEMVAARAGWIKRRRAEIQANRVERVTRQWVSGEQLPFLGESLELQVTPSPKKRLAHAEQEGVVLRVSLPSDLDDPAPLINKVVLRWYGLQAQAVFTERAQYFAEQLGVQPRAILVRNQERRWGSCTSDGTIRLCWRLVLAPMPIIDYVVVHELSHIQHPHHQRSFWDCVGPLLPEYRDRRAELKRDGERYRL